MQRWQMTQALITIRSSMSLTSTAIGQGILC